MNLKRNEVDHQHKENTHLVDGHRRNSRRISSEVNAAGDLVISVVDHGPLVEEFWGDSDYEFWYRVPAERVGVLARRLRATPEMLVEEIKEKWRGEQFYELEQILKSPDIEAKFASY